MSWQPPIKEITAPNMNRLVKVAKRDLKIPGRPGKIFNTETGQVAEWDSQLVRTWENWEYITDTCYPMYENGVYIGPGGWAKRD